VATRPGIFLPTRTFRTGQVSLHFAEGPQNGSPLVLLHGLSRDWRSFHPLLQELTRRFHVFAVDLRGHGGSSRVAGGYQIPGYGEDVREFISNVVPPGAAIFGHSLGAMVALWVAAAPSPRVQSVIVGDSMLWPQHFEHTFYGQFFTQLLPLLVREGSEEELAKAMGKITLRFPGLNEPVRIEELPQNMPEVLLEWARAAARSDPEALSMMLDGSALVGWDASILLPRVTCPTLLLQANPELDALLSDEEAAAALRLLPQANQVKFPLLGHALFMQQADPVLKAIFNFLDG
jgi:pimeloyl-ACP methyl ester carboxylesterase